jgi:rhodanese-related sulfurtransferase
MNRMHRLRAAILAATLTLALATLFAVQARAEGVAYIRPAEAKQRIERTPGVVVLDVRTPEEYAAGHLANSVLLPVDQVAAKAGTVLKDRDAAIVVYCHSGSRSDRAAKELKAQGYSHVSSVVGGIVAWNAAGYPVQK